MESKFEKSNEHQNKSEQNNSGMNSGAIFKTYNYDNDFIIKNNNQKACQFCSKKFYSKFNKDRHEISCKSNKNRFLKINNILDKEIIKTYSEKIEDLSKIYVEENIVNLFIGFKRNPENDLNNLQNEYKREKIINQDEEINCNKILFESGNVGQKINNKALLIEKIDEFLIISNKNEIKKSINDIIIDNFYSILKNNEYISIDRFFMFKNLIIGKGRYGTVFFGIDLANARPIAIKISNEEKRIKSLTQEIDIMTKLSKYKIFTKVYEQFMIQDQLYLIKTLQGHDLAKLRDFYGKKFSLTTVYKIGIDILRCFKLIHQLGYLYIDLKENNVAMLIKQIAYLKKLNNLILIDYGYCEKCNQDKDKSPKKHGCISYSSINSLKNNPISKKDDLISFCYFLVNLYNGYLPWDDISSDKNKSEEIIKMKGKYSFKKLLGNDAREISFIYDSVNNLKFNEIPKYDNYI